MISSIQHGDEEMRKSANIMKQKRFHMRHEFLSLTPLQRIRRMNKLFNEMIRLKAKGEGIREYEVYRRYIKTHE